MITIILILFASFITALALLIWFKSDAFIDWFSLLRLDKLIKLDEYQDKKMLSSDVKFSYPRFLKGRSKNFIFKILGCPLCLAIWLSMIAASPIALYNFFSLVDVTMVHVSFLGFLGFVGISNICFGSIICIVSLFIYGKISKLLNEN